MSGAPSRPGVAGATAGPVAPAPTVDDARRAILSLVRDAAGDGAVSLIMRRARENRALRYLADTTDDANLVGPAVEAALAAELLMLEAPVIDAGDLVPKLACLTAELLRGFDGSPQSVNRLALAAGSLADAVVLAGGAIALPCGAQRGVQDGDTATAAAWLAELAANGLVHA